MIAMGLRSHVIRVLSVGIASLAPWVAAAGESAVSRVACPVRENDPRAVSRIITEQFLSSDPLAYKPKGTDIAKHFKTGYGWGNSIFYATASLWVNAVENARQFGETNLEARLVEKFRPYLVREKDVLRPQFHVDYNVVGAVPLAVARMTGDAKAREIGLRLADFQWSEPRKDAPVLNGNPGYVESLRLWKAGYSGETRLWIDDMYMINLLQTEAYKLTGDRKYVDRAAREMCLYLGGNCKTLLG